MGFAIKQDGGLHPAGGFRDNLEPGVYRIDHTMIGPILYHADLASDELLDVPGTPADAVLADVRAFLAKEHDYAAYGMTHRRGYLLYGPPGSGKTTVAVQVARRFIQDGGVVFTGYPHDLEAIAWLGESHLQGRHVMITMDDPRLADLSKPPALAVLDGTRKVSGLVVMVTTNTLPGELPPRIVNRPGRFDQVVLIDRISQSVQLAFLEKIQARVPSGPKPARDIVAALDGLPVTLAHLKEAFLAHVILGERLPTIRRRFEAMLNPPKAPAAEDEDDEDD